MKTIIATAKNTSHNNWDIWIEEGEFNYMLPGFYYQYLGSPDPIEDFANEIIFTVKSWSEEDNGVKTAILN